MRGGGFPVEEKATRYTRNRPFAFDRSVDGDLIPLAKGS
jgi:hypothetical protein